MVLQWPHMSLTHINIILQSALMRIKKQDKDNIFVMSSLRALKTKQQGVKITPEYMGYIWESHREHIAPTSSLLDVTGLTDTKSVNNTPNPSTLKKE